MAPDNDIEEGNDSLARQPHVNRLETPNESCGLLGPDRPHFRPHISATPRDETDRRQRVSLKTSDMRDQTDTQQPLASAF